MNKADKKKLMDEYKMMLVYQWKENYFMSYLIF